MNRYLKFMIQLLLALFTAVSGAVHASTAGAVIFVSGEAEMNGVAVSVNDAVNEGAEFSTGASGYLYLKTVDNGFFILRPNSRARIVSYHIDIKDPRNTRIKLELINGVARSISGDAVKQARQNFRFNTPVAAIGVRGTDFTVYTTSETSRVSVVSGGVVVSGFGGTCSSVGSGPCEGAASAELFARQHGELLQVNRGQIKPMLLKSNLSAPDVIAPPRPDEPNGKNTSSSQNGVSPGSANEVYLDPKKVTDLKQVITNTPLPVIVPPVLPPEPVSNLNAPSQITWGRWEVVLGKPAQLDLVSLLGEKKNIAIVESFALFQDKNTEWKVPNTGSLGFALKESEAYVRDEVKNIYSPAQVQNASLNVDFAKSTFATSFDLLTTNGTYKLNSRGHINQVGQFSNDNIFNSNASVQGVLSAQNGGTAAYLFRARLDDTHLATGGTFWGKK
jgi:hypothetical protein